MMPRPRAASYAAWSATSVRIAPHGKLHVPVRPCCRWLPDPPRLLVLGPTAASPSGTGTSPRSPIVRRSLAHSFGAGRAAAPRFVQPRVA